MEVDECRFAILKSIIQDCLVFNIPKSVRAISIHLSIDLVLYVESYFAEAPSLTHTSVINGAFWEAYHEIGFLKDVRFNSIVTTDIIIPLKEEHFWVYFVHEDL